MILVKEDLDMQNGITDSIPFVAVWMVTYNHESSIVESVESVVKQETDFNYKLYIGEDCSKDNTRARCIQLKEKYPDKIELILNETNLGPKKNAGNIYRACR